MLRRSVSYEHCEKHDCDATNGCLACAREKGTGPFNQSMYWRTNPPTAAELADPKIIGWAFEGTIDGAPVVPIVLRLVLTASSDPVVHMPGSDYDMRLAQCIGKWCPIYAPEEA